LALGEVEVRAFGGDQVAEQGVNLGHWRGSEKVFGLWERRAVLQGYAGCRMMDQDSKKAFI
jgi:hypothetical protein